MTQQELHEAFIGFIDSGDEQGAKDFLIEHLNEFPEETIKEIAFAFFVDAVEKDNQLNDVKEKALDMMKEMDNMESDIEDIQKVNSIKSEI